MGDQRFDDRLKRIHARQKNGAPIEMLAGVGDKDEAQEAAQGKPRASLILALLGACIGTWAFHTLKTQVGLAEMLTYPPEMLLEIGLSEPTIGAAAAVLGFSSLLAFISLVRGRKAFKMMSFSFASLGGAVGGLVLAAA